MDAGEDFNYDEIRSRCSLCLCPVYLWFVRVEKTTNNQSVPTDSFASFRSRICGGVRGASYETCVLQSLLYEKFQEEELLISNRKLFCCMTSFRYSLYPLSLPLFISSDDGLDKWQTF
jgi:hypothetical protein